MKQIPAVEQPMQKSVARNPNMLRTLIGLGLTLILVLGYAVYSASLDSEYYLYTTSNEEVDIQLELEDPGDGTLVYSTEISGAFTWVNFSVDGLPADGEFEATSGGQQWWSHPALVDEDATMFNCLAPDDNFSIVNNCDRSFTHTAVPDEQGQTLLRGLLDYELPLSGTGSLRAVNESVARDDVEQLISGANDTVTWRMVLRAEGDIDSASVTVTMTVVQHELVDVEPFKLDPITEGFWSLTALLGCLSLVLLLPLGFYYGSRLKDKAEERGRDAALAEATEYSSDSA